MSFQIGGTMKYREIDKDLARQCCKEHTVFNDKRHKERVCDHCPLRRDFKDVEGNIRRGICWFILVEGLGIDLMNKSLYAHAEKAILDEEDVSHPKEFLKWLKNHKETQEEVK